MTTTNRKVLFEKNKITAFLRSAIFLNTNVKIVKKGKVLREINETRILSAKEDGLGRHLTVSSIDLFVDDKNQALSSVFEHDIGATYTLSFTVADNKVTFDGKLAEISSGKITVNDFSKLKIEYVRKSARRNLQIFAEGWGSLEFSETSAPASIRLINYSSQGLGVKIKTKAILPKDQIIRLSGVVTSNKLSMRIDNAVVIRRVKIKKTKPSAWNSYVVGCFLENKKEGNISSERRESRKSKRFIGSEIMRLKNQMNLNREYKIKIKNIALEGLACNLLFDGDASAFPVGSPVEIPEIGMSGRIISCCGSELRIRLDINNAKSFKNWFLKFTEAFHPSMDTWVDFFEQAAIAFATSGGTSSAFLKSSGEVNEYQKHEVTSLDRDPNWIQTWVEKNRSGQTIGHISCVRYGDNLWYAGDLWGSQLDSINKDFAKNFLDSFISYALACRPYPKSLGIWKPDHPYWQALNRALAGEYSHYIFEESSCYKVCLLDRKSYRQIINDKNLEIIDSFSISRIQDIQKELEKNGIAYFAKLLGFDVDSFGSPRLQTLIQDSGYAFERIYARVSARGNSFLAIYSRYPSGTSIQNHQETVWLLPLTEVSDESAKFEDVVNIVASFSLQLGILPAYIKVVTKQRLSFLPAPMRLVIGDPRMWGLS